MYIGENRAFLYFPDDPQFLTDQYIQTVRLMDSIRNLVLSFNRDAKHQIKELEKFSKIWYSESDTMSKTLLAKHYALLLKRLHQIEMFRTRTEKILDLLRACAVSKYQDHSDLLKAMMKENGLDDIRISLEHNIMTLDRFHMYLTNQLKRQIDDRNQEADDRSQIYQRRIAAIGFYLTALSTLSAIIAILPYLVAIYPSLVGFMMLLGDIIRRNSILLLTGILLVGFGVPASFVVNRIVRLRKWKR